MSQTPIKLLITIQEESADSERLYELATTLRKHLQNFDIESVERQQTHMASTGEKGDPITWGALVLVTMPAVLPQVITFFQNWLIERRKVAIETPNGTKLEFTPNKKFSQDEILVLVRELNQISQSSADSPDSEVENPPD